MIFEVVTSVVVVWLLWWTLKTYQERKGMPPGPIPLPFIGNALQLRGDVWKRFEELRQEYGDIYTLSQPTGTAVIISSGELQYEEMVTRKDDLAGRDPQSMYPIHLVFKGGDIVTEQVGKKHTLRRKVFRTAIHAYGAAGSENVGKREARILPLHVDSRGTQHPSTYKTSKIV